MRKLTQGLCWTAVVAAGLAVCAAGRATADGFARGAVNYSMDVAYIHREVIESSSASYQMLASTLLLGPEAPVQVSTSYSLTLAEMPASVPETNVEDWWLYE